MPVQDMNLPVNIPWRRMAAPVDMLVNAGGSPSIGYWKPSVVLSYFLVPESETVPELACDGIRLLLLKASISITGVRNSQAAVKGVNPDDPELSAILLSSINRYYDCVGALLELAVVPKKEVENMDDLPYIVDIMPRTRELVESAQMQTNQLQASDDKVGVLKSGTQTSEWNIQATVSGAGKIGGIGAEASVTGGYRGGSTSVDQTSTDTSREKRESLAYTLNLNHVYQLFNAYYVGVNRSAVVIQPRPHQSTAQNDPAYFRLFNGLRTMEGLQDVLFVVAIPEASKEFCVRSRLLTGHFVPIVTKHDTGAKAPPPQSEPTWGEIALWATKEYGGKDYEYYHEGEECLYHVHVVCFKVDAAGNLVISAYRKEKEDLAIAWFPAQIGGPETIKNSYLQAHPMAAVADIVPSVEVRTDDGIIFVETTVGRCGAIQDDKLALDPVQIAGGTSDGEVPVVSEMRVPRVDLARLVKKIGMPGDIWGQLGQMNLTNQRIVREMLRSSAVSVRAEKIPFASTGIAKDVMKFAAATVAPGAAGDVPLKGFKNGKLLAADLLKKLKARGVNTMGELFRARLEGLPASERRKLAAARNTVLAHLSEARRG